MYVHTHKYTYTCSTYTQTHAHIHVHTCRHLYRYTHVQRHMYMHPPLTSCSTSLFTHRAGYCTLGGGREHSTHSFLCFHCAQLLRSLTAPSAKDRSGLSSEPAQQGGPGGHTLPHHNFHSPLASGNFKP
ncbi:unnamed protein product [Staurois parvus]|uniref:Uncharacterized protein n=1 Tax=Staurois parvus TaxID=386267 RepID=A0ABN9EV53_9NEOB|nr:unnamed protein product [Staurois parvus]